MNDLVHQTAFRSKFRASELLLGIMNNMIGSSNYLLWWPNETIIGSAISAIKSEPCMMRMALMQYELEI